MGNSQDRTIAVGVGVGESKDPMAPEDNLTCHNLSVGQSLFTIQMKNKI